MQANAQAGDGCACGARLGVFGSSGCFPRTGEGGWGGRGWFERVCFRIGVRPLHISMSAAFDMSSFVFALLLLAAVALSALFAALSRRGRRTLWISVVGI